jgi:hypothetical protein
MSLDETPAGCIGLEDLSAFVDGELDAAMAEHVRAHAADCERCGALLARLGNTSRVVAALPREEATPALLRQVVAASVAAQSRRRPAWSRWASAAAIVLCCIVAYRVTQLAKNEPMMAVAERAPSRRADVRQPAPAEPPSITMGEAAADSAPLADRTTANVEAQKNDDLAFSTGAFVQYPEGADGDSGGRREADARSASRTQPAPSEAEVKLAAPAPSAAPLPAERSAAAGAALGNVAAPAAPPPSAAKKRAEAGELEAAVAADVAKEESGPARDAEMAEARSKDLAQAAEQRRVAEAHVRAAQAAATRHAKSQAEAESPLQGARELALEAGTEIPPQCGRVRRAPEEIPRALLPEMTPPVFLSGADPQWPATFRRAQVRVEAVIEIDGTVSTCRIDGDVPADAQLAIRQAIATWRYRPARLDGRPQAVAFDVTFDALSGR